MCSKTLLTTFCTGDYLQAVYFIEISYTKKAINGFRAMLNNYIYLAYLFKLNNNAARFSNL